MFNLKKIESLDKFLLAFASLVPLSLIVSIFVADLMASLSGLILIYIFFFEKDNLKFFRTIKKEILFFSIFFLVILISFFINGFKSYSLLPSLFYFRYFLFALSIFYLLNKYNFLEKEFFFIIIITFSIVIFDSFIQLIFKKNIFGYISIDYEGGVTYLTSFFKDEKKLGSYLVRFLPLLLSLVVINNFKNSNKIEITILLIAGIIIFFSSDFLQNSLLCGFNPKIAIFGFLLINFEKYELIIFVFFTIIFKLIVFDIFLTSICVVRGATASFLLYISITASFLSLFFFDKYSVTPIFFSPKVFLLSIEQFIKPLITFLVAK